MQKRSNEQSLKEAIDEFLKVYKLNKGLEERSIIDAWEKILGKTIANNYTTDIQLRNKILYVKLQSPALRQEILFYKQKLIQALHDQLGKQDLIKDIVFM